jgi:hypothetical protein
MEAPANIPPIISAYEKDCERSGQDALGDARLEEAQFPHVAREDARPPILQGPARRRTAEVFFGLVALAVVGALASGYLGIGFPQCSFKTLTGLPCAFCGGTRSLRAIGHLHLVEAFWFNPLVMIGALVAGICAIFSAVAPQRFDRLVARVKRLPLLFIGFALVVVNWIFVLKFLPR